MIFKAIILALLLAPTLAHAAPRTGHFERLQLIDNSINYVELRAPVGVTSWSMTMPPNDGAAGQFMATDGSGVATWTSSFTDLTGNSVTLGNGAGRCLLFDSDTGLCSASDGEISFINNGFTNFSTSQNYVAFEGIPYYFPGSLGVAGSVLTDAAGDGILSWSPIVVDRLEINQTKTTTGGENVNYIYQSLAATADGNDVTMLNIESDVATDFGWNSVTGLRISVDQEQNSNTTNTNGITIQSTMGRDADPTTIQNHYAISSSVLVNAGVTLTGTVSGLSQIFDSDAGSTIENLQGAAFGGTIAGTVNNVNGLSWTPNIDRIANSTNLLNFGGTIGSKGGHFNIVNIGMDVGDSDLGAGTGGLTVLNDGVTFGDTNSFTAWSHHPQGDFIRYDYNLIESGGQILEIGRNMNRVNFHDDFDLIGENYNGYSDTTNIDHLEAGSVQAMQLNVQASVPGDSTMLNVNPRITQRGPENQIVTIQAKADVSASLSGKYFRFCTAYSEPGGNTCFKPWFDVDNASTPPSADGDTLVEIDITEDATAADNGDSLQAALDPEAKIIVTDDGAGLVTIEIVANGRAGGIDTGGLNPDPWEARTTQGGGGDGNLYGVNINMTQASGYAPENLIGLQVVGGTTNVERFNSNQNRTIVSSPGNPTTVNAMNINYQAGDGVTITDADAIGTGGISSFNVGDGSTLTSGPLGLGHVSTANIVLSSVGTGSTAQHVGGNMSAVIAVAGAGFVTNAYGYRAVASNFGAPGGITNFRAYIADEIGTPPGATAWGLWAREPYYNWMGGSLKIGGTAGVSDTTGAGTKLHVQDGNFLLDNGHIRSIQTVGLSALEDPNAGTGADCTVMGETDVTGTIELTTTNTASAAGEQCAVVFDQVYGVAPICSLTPANDEAALHAVDQGVYVSSTVANVIVNFAVAEAVGRTYRWNYHCIETE